MSEHATTVVQTGAWGECSAKCVCGWHVTDYPESARRAAAEHEQSERKDSA